jgi:hypothetical protein
MPQQTSPPEECNLTSMNNERFEGQSTPRYRVNIMHVLSQPFVTGSGISANIL